MTITTYGFDGTLSDHFQTLVDDADPFTSLQTNGVLQLHTHGESPGSTDKVDIFLAKDISSGYDQSWTAEITATVPAIPSLIHTNPDPYLEAFLGVFCWKSDGTRYSFANSLGFGGIRDVRQYNAEYGVATPDGVWTERLVDQGERQTTDVSGQIRIHYDATTKELTAYHNGISQLTIDLDATGVTNWQMTSSDTFKIGIGFYAADWQVPENLALKLDNFSFNVESNGSPTGGTGNDTLRGSSGNDSVDGGAGIDSAVYSGNRSDYTLTRTSSGWTISGGTEGTDTLTNLERLQFGDKKVALDVSPTGNAGLALEFIGTLAFSKMEDRSLIGTVLSFLDQGTSLHGLFQLLIDAGIVSQLAGSDNNADLARLIYRNVVGSEASVDVANTLASYLQGSGGTLSKADFLTTIAGLELNQAHVNLVGLAQVGVEYI